MTIFTPSPISYYQMPMKRFISTFCLLMLAGSVPVLAQHDDDQCDDSVIQVDQSKIFTITDHIRFCEGSVATKQGVLVSNFGAEELDPLGNEGKGYILSLDKHGVHKLIPADGSLDAPKGMAIVREEYLFIADVGKVVVYNLKKVKAGNCKSLTIPLPEGELFANDVIALGDFLLISITDTGSIFALDVKNCEQLHGVKPKFIGTIPGANGFAERDGTLYIASCSTDNIPKPENVIYAIDLTQPDIKPVNILNDRKGSYDGVAVSADGSKLYFSSWKGPHGKPEIGFVDLTEGKDYAVTVLDLGIELGGPADISISNGYLYVPDQLNNTIYIVGL